MIKVLRNKYCGSRRSNEDIYNLESVDDRLSKIIETIEEGVGNEF